jgi:hypothetical protein
MAIAAANRSGQASMNFFIIAPETVARHLDGWGIQTLEANHEKHFDDRDRLSGRFVRLPSPQRRERQRRGLSYLRDATAWPTMKAARIAASRATRSAWRRLRVSAPNAMATRSATTKLLATAAGPANTRLLVSDRASTDRAAVQACSLSGQIISNRPPWPEWIARRKPCSFTIAATRLSPRPTPGVFRILSER